MRRYETIYIIRSNTTEDDIDATIAKANGIIENFGGTVLNVNKWGLKKLAYLIKKESQGYYVHTEYAGVPKAVDEIERVFRIDDNILKYLTVKLQDTYIPDEPASEESEDTPEDEAATAETTDTPEAAAATAETTDTPEAAAATAETTDTPEAAAATAETTDTPEAAAATAETTDTPEAAAATAETTDTPEAAAATAETTDTPEAAADDAGNSEKE